MGNTKSTPSSRSPFSTLPLELRRMIWKHAADAWISQYLSKLFTWSVAGKRIFLITIVTDTKYYRDDTGQPIREKGYKIKMPVLLFVCHEARSVMHDALLQFQSQRPGGGIGSGKTVGSREEELGQGEVQLFIRDASQQANNFLCPQIYGWRIIDLRSTSAPQSPHPTLADSVQRERERLEQLSKEIAEVGQKRVVDPRKAPEGYVRLPLMHPAKSSMVVWEEGRRKEVQLYPEWEMEVRVNRECRGVVGW